MALAILGTLALARALAPMVIEQRINHELDTLERYTGKVGGVDLHLWRAAYSIQDVRITKRDEAPDRPLFAADNLHFSFHAASHAEQVLVTTVILGQPRINFVDGAGDRDQAGGGANWLRLFDRLSPLPIDRLAVDRGEVHFYNFAGAHVHLADVKGTISDVSRTPDKAQPLPARLDVAANAMGSAPAKLEADLAPRVQPPAFQLKFRMKDLDLSDFRLLAKTYAPFDINSGRMDLVMELDAGDGAIDGYAKPLLRDVEILSIPVDIQQDHDDPLRLTLEAASALVAELLENRASDQIATRIPISGNLDAMQRDWFAAVGGILANAFIEGLRANFESEPPDEAPEDPATPDPSDLRFTP